MENQTYNKKISIIIPTKNRTSDVITCLNSILIQTIHPNEVIIVDSSDLIILDSEIKKFKKLNIKYFHTKPGRCYQRNFGIKKSKGDILIFLDDDVILDKNYIKEILYVFESFPYNKIGGITSRQKLKRVKFSKKILLNLYNIFAKIFFLGGYKNGKFQHSGIPSPFSAKINEIKKCEFLYGFSMAFRSEVIKEFRGFDENLEKYSGIVGEDDDIAYRVSRKYQNYFTPFAKLIHNCSPAARDNNFSVMQNGFRQYYYLFHKNMPQTILSKIIFWWAFLGLLIKEIFMIINFRKDDSGLFGLISGFLEIFKRKK